jgi:hypothetical protein
MVTPFLGVRREMDPRPLAGDNDPLLLQRLDFNARVFVLAEYARNWVRLRTDEGVEGFVDRNYLFIGAPEPEAKLYRTQAGDTALGIAQQQYHCGEWGKDGRFFTNVLVHVNEGEGDPRRGIYKEDTNGSWATTKVRAGYWIWIPSEGFARSLAGVVSSGSISYELWQKLKGFVGFLVGLVDGFITAFTSLVTGIVDLASSVIDFVVKIVRDGITSTIDEIKSIIEKLNPKDIVAAIWRNFVDRWNAGDAWERWRFRGEVVGTLIAEILMAFFSGGSALIAKAAAKFGKLGSMIRESKAVGRIVRAAESARDRLPGIKTLRRGLRERAQAEGGVPDIGEMVERGILEEAADTARPARRPRPSPPAARGQAEAARTGFNTVRETYAARLGVGPGGQVHHAIELQALDRYPGVFTPDELNDFANMRGIATELRGRRQLHNSKVREIWDRHYRSLDWQIRERGLRPGTAAYDSYVRNFIEAGRDEIDHVLGQFFSEYRSSLSWHRTSVP